MNRPGSPASVRSAAGFALLISIMMPIWSSTGSASPFDHRPKILVHLGPTTAPNPCSVTASDCGYLKTSGSLSPQYAYLVAARGSLSSLAGIECGILYGNGQPSAMNDGSGLDVLSWNLCADAFYPSAGPNQWPRPGGGALIVWNECQTGEFAVAGYFYVTAYSPDNLQVTRRPVSSEAKVANCSKSETLLLGRDLGSASFGSASDCNPCLRSCPDPATPPYIPPVDIPPPPPQEGDPGVPWVLLHAQPAVTGGNACAHGEIADPADAVVTAGLSKQGTGPFYQVYLLVARDNLTSLSGLSCGITYENGSATGQKNGSGVDILSWNLCADVELRAAGSRSWPAPGSGNLIVWNPQGNCRTGTVEVAGYFYVAAYSSDNLSIIPKAGSQSVEVVNCYIPSTVVPAEHLGSVAFSENATVPGVNPWLAGHPDHGVPVESTTWSSIKSLYSSR